MPSPSTSAARRADVDAPEVLWLGDRRAGDPTLAGGKAASLSRLAARHAVPPGFVVSIPAATLDRRARTAVTSAYRALAESVGEAAPAVAVRSSAVDEDGARASFAGQHDTFLNVAGPEQVWWAVARCVSSFGGDRALAYRRRTGLPDAPARAAVLVQLLVRADAAGVVFSANPVTGARDEAVVNAAWGLGESVVSGTVTPDAIVVGHADGGIRSHAVAEKRTMTVAVTGGTREMPVPGCLAREPAVDAAQARAAARLALALEGETGAPVDVEVAWAGAELFLLQCRPITTLRTRQEHQ